MKVLLVDDHPLILSALQTVIQGLGDHVSVVGAGSARAARETLAGDDDFDLVLLDLHLGDADGFDLLVEFRSTYPALPVVVVSASDRASDVIRSIDLGAMGFVPKRASNETLFDALRMVMSGGIYVPPISIGNDRPAERAGGEPGLPGALGTVAEAAQASGFQQHPSIASLGLTPRQNEVLAYATALALSQAHDRLRTPASQAQMKQAADRELRSLLIALAQPLGLAIRPEQIAIEPMDPAQPAAPPAWTPRIDAAGVPDAATLKMLKDAGCAS